MKYKLFITDYDGTLGFLNDINEETVSAIKDYQARGGKFVICSGRSYKSILPILNKYGIKGKIITFQGAVICDIETGEKIYDGECAKKDILDIKEDIEREGISVGVYLGDYLHYEPSQSIYFKTYIEKVGAMAIKVENLTETIEKTHLKVRKIIVPGGEGDIAKLRDNLSKKYSGRLIVNTSSKNLFEAVSPLNSKGESVKRIAKFYGVPLSEVITVGDSLNDIELVKGEWHGVAVGDAVDELKKVAKEITVPFNEQPIKYLLHKYGI